MTKAFDGENGLSISVLSDTDHSGAAQVASSLAGEVLADFGPRGETPLSIVARDGETVVGGLNGSSHWGWCYIRHLWVDAAWRRRGLGRRLLAEAEAEARGRGCAGLYVDTFNEAAVSFYERAGFARFGRIEGFPPGHARTFLAKRLDGAVDPMKLEYTILSFPEDPSGYHAVTQTDARVLLSIDEVEFLDLEDILILEFACYVNSWLQNARANDIRSFYFISMDEEEEPLLALDRLPNGNFRAHSCWSDTASRELSHKEVESCFFNFIESIRSCLQNDFHYNLDDALGRFRVE